MKRGHFQREVFWMWLIPAAISFVALAAVILAPCSPGLYAPRDGRGGGAAVSRPVPK